MCIHVNVALKRAVGLEYRVRNAYSLSPEVFLSNSTLHYRGICIHYVTIYVNLKRFLYFSNANYIIIGLKISVLSSRTFSVLICIPVCPLLTGCFILLFYICLYGFAMLFKFNPISYLFPKLIAISNPFPVIKVEKHEKAIQTLDRNNQQKGGKRKQMKMKTVTSFYDILSTKQVGKLMNSVWRKYIYHTSHENVLIMILGNICFFYHLWYFSQFFSSLEMMPHNVCLKACQQFYFFSHQMISISLLRHARYFCDTSHSFFLF
uniref:Signal peptide protein n=1 Tax=Heterorhabditis bacteriophora TaxID=37862 RepID=A0A1I7WDP9_HETBA